MIRKFHLAKLAMEQDIDGVLADEHKHGPITPDVREMIGLDPFSPITSDSTLTPPAAVTLWGTGTPRREFLYSDDMADACVYLGGLDEKRFDELLWPLGKSQSSDMAGAPLVNVGVGHDLEIIELARVIREVIGYAGEIQFDRTKPDGTPRKLMDVSKMKEAGWVAKTPFFEGVRRAYDSYKC